MEALKKKQQRKKTHILTASKSVFVILLWLYVLQAFACFYSSKTNSFFGGEYKKKKSTEIAQLSWSHKKATIGAWLKAEEVEIRMCTSRANTWKYYTNVRLWVHNVNTDDGMAEQNIAE